MITRNGCGDLDHAGKMGHRLERGGIFCEGRTTADAPRTQQGILAAGGKPDRFLDAYLIFKG